MRADERVGSNVLLQKLAVRLHEGARPSVKLLFATKERDSKAKVLVRQHDAYDNGEAETKNSFSHSKSGIAFYCAYCRAGFRSIAT
jgi:hypothetical protein